MNNNLDKAIVEVLKEKNNLSLSTFNSFLLKTPGKTRRIYNMIEKRKIIKSKFSSIMLPKSISRIASNKIYFFDDANVTDIIELVSLYTKMFHKEINLFLDKKKEYEDLFYKGYYESAMSILNNIEEDICFSLWGVKQKLVINDLIGGLEQNKLYLETITKQSKNRAYLDILFNFYSTMSEKQTSYDNYQSIVRKFFGSSTGNVASYLKYKLDLEYEFKIEDFQKIVEIESYSSIIDLYLSFIDIYPKYLFKSLNKDIPKLLCSSFDKINDSRASNMFLQQGIKNLNLRLNKSGDVYNYNEIIEHYSIGDYDYVNKNLSKYLNENVSDFQTTTIYIKSLIQNRETTDDLLDINKCMYSMYALDDNYFESKQKMFRYRKQFKETSWEPKIISFLKRRESLETSINEIDVSSYLNDKMITPNFSNVIFDEEVSKKFTKKIEDAFPKTTKIISQVGLDLIQDSFRKKYMELQQNEINITNMFDSLESLIFDSKYSLFSRERAAIRLSDILLEKEKYFEFINLAVKLYFENPLLIKRLNLYNCLMKIRKRPSSDIKVSITYPIFVYLCDKSNKRIKNIAISNFLDSNNIFDLNGIFTAKFEKKQKNFFLYYILDIYSLKKDIRFLQNAEKAEDVRLRILNWLIDEDSRNKKRYVDEVNEINKESALRERISRINKSKIFVDSQKIYDENKKLWKEDYSNYVDAKRFDRKIYTTDIEMFKDMSDLEYINKITKDINKKIETDVTYHQEILMLKNILMKILDELLSNTTHGLETYLSSRIRHGYTKNHLTNVFYEYNLMSKSNSIDDKNYFINDYWDNKKNENPSKFADFKQFISEFTANIENMVNTINNKWLQIKRHQSDEGLFDYTDLVDILIVSYRDNNFSSFKELFETFVTLFWLRTERNLKEIQLQVNNNLKFFFYEKLDELERQISTLNVNGMTKIISECLSNINLCRTRIESTINNFSEVFEKPNINHKNFTMSELIETALSISGKMHKDFNDISITQLVDVGSIIEGRYLPYFIDSLSILINNAIEHSSFKNLSDLKLTIDISEMLKDSKDWAKYNEMFISKQLTISEKNEFVCIKVSNNIGSNVDVQKIKQAFEVAESVDRVKELVQSEGGTGLIKLFNIFKNSLPVSFIITSEIKDQIITISVVFSVENMLERR